ncbi:sensor histidine kinase [Paracoccus salsus]|uniref:sensor histidine kinase n=1 Tax=Paracoccus salsus TaxID=2911061 RepID=UPI001F24D031|nr:sensor histidine kinase [Paracoccus salsus]MCF3973006.1 sensor histidine kinase [Paracoccus salsus]
MTGRSQAPIADLALDAHPCTTLVVDLEGRVLYANAAGRNAFGLARPSGPVPCDIAGWKTRPMPLADLLRSASMSSNWIPAHFFRDEVSIHARARGLPPDGTAMPRILIASVADSTAQFSIHAQQIRDLNSQLALYQKKSDELEASVAVAKFLERELVHRVKNNLAIISALLNEQARSAGDQSVSGALRSAASRIKSIAVVHDILDSNHQTEIVELAELMPKLINGIRAALCPKHIRIEVETESAAIHIDLALPLALLVNELVTNAIKHAFPGRSSGRIHCRCTILDVEIEITVSDDGVGLPVDRAGEPRQPYMVGALVSQIDGSMECRLDQGTEWRLRFPFRATRRLAATVGSG